MSKESILLAKVAALKKSFDDISYNRGRCFGSIVKPLFPRYEQTIAELKGLNPEMYNDIPDTKIPESMGSMQGGSLYEQYRIEPLVQNLSYILELSSQIRIGQDHEDKESQKKVFISHGRSKEWTKIQPYLERDLGIQTLELAQEPNLGRTILQKLNEESQKCSVAVIVMTGEDMTEDGEIRARENVLHEIGFFQGAYGFSRIILLHEHGVNIPSNIHGLVYIGFPKDTAEAALGALTRELKVLIL